MNFEKLEKLEKQYESMRAFQLAKDLATLMLERPVEVPFVVDAGEPTPEPDYEQLILGYAEIDARSWDVV